MPYSPIEIRIDKATINRLQLKFSAYPKTINRILTESINKSANKARTALVNLASTLTKIPKRTVRRFTSIKKANAKTLAAWVRAYSRRIPVRYLGFVKGPLVVKIVPTTLKQSIWMYHNVFVPKYGKKNAIFSRKYKLKKMVHSYLSYKRGRKQVMLPPSAFIATFPRTGYWGAFVPTRSTGKSGQEYRSMTEIVGPSVGEVLNENKQDLNVIQAQAMSGLGADIDARIGRYIKMRNTGTLPTGRKIA